MNKHNSRRNIILNSLPFIIGLVVLALVRLGSVFPGHVEEYYAKGIYPAIAVFVSGLSSHIRYSLWDIFWISMSLFVLTGLILVIMKKIRPGRYILRFSQMLVMFYSLFYLSWGFNYFRPDIRTRLGWSQLKPDEGMFRTVLDSLIVSTNMTFTEVDHAEYRSIDEALERSFSRCSDILAINYPNGIRTPKTILISSYFAKSGVSGYFGPFFNEVHINHYELPGDYPFIVAHEKAHQFGLANEAEANLAAFIVCTGSGDRRLQYSANLHLLLYFLKDARNMPGYGNYIAKIDSRVMKDILDREAYYDHLRNKRLENIQNAANDAYLKTQHIEKGIKNYNQVVALTISWYAESGRLPVQEGETFARIGEKTLN